MYLNTKALVLRETQYREADKILTLLTPDEGKLTVSARGALRKGSKLTAASQHLAYANVTLLVSRGRYTLTEAEVLESFQPLRGEIERFALGAYVADALEAVCGEGVECSELLELGLNTLYALGQAKWEPEHTKAAFEWRLTALSGYEPQLGFCALCDEPVTDGGTLLLSDGQMYCPHCYESVPLGSRAALTEPVLSAVRYCVSCPPKKLFSFALSQKSDILLFRQTAERYLLTMLERGFSTLDFFHSL